MAVSDDKEVLVGFITDFYSWLDACYLENGSSVSPEKDWPVIFPYVVLRADGRLAWLELKNQQTLASTVSLIREVSVEKLQAHGLTGAQLKYKIAVLKDLVKRMRRVKFSGKFKRKLIDAIDTILDSLIGALGLATALKEIKDMLRAQI